jgi:hypothetical protein
VTDRAAFDHLDRPLSTLTQCALHRRTVCLSCRACPHERLLDAIPLWWMFDRRGWSLELREVPRKFYCGPCWSQRCKKVSRPRLELTNRAFEGEQFVYPDERAWRRLVSRYRS